MLKLTFKRSLQLTTFFLSFSITSMSFASNGDLLAYITKVVNSTVNATANLLYEFNTNLPNTIIANMNQSVVKHNVQETATNLSLRQIKSTLVPPPTNVRLLQLAGIPASDSLLSSSGVFSLSSGSQETPNLINGDKNFSLDSLIGPTEYDQPIGSKYAENFIRFLTNQATPLSSVNTTSLNEDAKKRLQSSSIYQRYQVLLRNAVSQQSVAFSNLYHLFAERQIQKGLGTKAGVKNNQGKAVENTSPLQVEKYLATRRVDDPQWYAEMSTASPTTISRETLFVLGEIERQQFQLHLDNERMLATLSAIELQNTSTGELDSASSNVKKLISQIQQQGS